MNCSAVSHPQPAVESKFSTWLKFMPPLLQWSVTAVGGLCLEKQTIDLLELYCVCDFISKTSKGRRWAVKVKAKFLGTLGCLALSSPHNVWWMHRIYTLIHVYPNMSLKQMEYLFYKDTHPFSVAGSILYVLLLFTVYKVCTLCSVNVNENISKLIKKHHKINVQRCENY